MHFVYTGLPARVVFGRGTSANAAAELARLGVTRALVLTTPGHADHGRALGVGVGVFAGAVMHTPVAVTARALEVMRELGADGVVALGGGATIGLGKAIA
ncbi:MAG: iron-containing alcohol dehydrogenase, partial [Kofleriaceae bacterium]